MTSHTIAAMTTSDFQTLLTEAAHHLHSAQDVSRVRQLAQQILAACGGHLPAAEVPWYDIASAPCEIVHSQDGHQYGPYLLVAVGECVVRARWWQSARDPKVSNFLEDGGQACFPSAWTHLPPAPKPAAILPAPGASPAKAQRGRRKRVEKPTSDFVARWTKVIKETPSS